MAMMTSTATRATINDDDNHTTINDNDDEIDTDDAGENVIMAMVMSLQK